MNREQAEKLLAALIFDDLDEPSKAELLAYLQTDDELRDRLADMRLAIKLADNAVNDGPAPILSEGRLRQLEQLAGTGKTTRRIFTMRRLPAVAAVLVLGFILVGLFMPALSRSKSSSRSVQQAAARRQAEIAEMLTGGTSAPALALADSSKRPVADEGAGPPASGGYGGMMGGMGGSEGGTADNVSGMTAYGGAVTYEYRGTAPAISDALTLSSNGALGGGAGGGQFSRRRGVSASDTELDLLAGYTQADGKSNTADGIPNVSHLYSSSDTPPVAAAPPVGGPAAGTEGETRSAFGVNSPASVHKEVALGQPWSAEQPASSPETAASLTTKQPVDSSATEGRTGDIVAKTVEGLPPVMMQIDRDFDPNTSEPAESLSVPSQFREEPVNPWVLTERDAVSTFALDADTASYALCRRYIHSGYLPPTGAVRMEEFINAFDYAYPQRDDATFAVYAEAAPSPFAQAGQDLTLLKIAVKARTVGRDQRRAAHLVFVVDASASMGQADRLPLIQSALSLLVDKLSEADRVSLITCASEARLHLEAVPASQKDAIRRTIEAIQPAGPTNLMAGLRLGYAMARKAFVAGRINQVVLCSDGVANVGQTQAEAVLGSVAEDRKQGITLTCVGVGYGAYNDAFLEAMADRGDGRYVFLDASKEAGEALVGQLAATLETVARDARIQVRFSPDRVRRYRLIGYENRQVEDRRFRDDTIDAGEVGSGQCSTALYELELAPGVRGGGDAGLGTVFVRYRQGETGQIEEISRPLADSIVRRRSVEEDPRFFLAAGVARFAEWLRQSEHAARTSPRDIQRLLDQVAAALPLDRDVQDLAALSHRAENLPRAPQTTPMP